MNAEPAATPSEPIAKRRGSWTTPIVLIVFALLLNYLVRTAAAERDLLSPANTNIASLIILGLAFIAVTVWIGLRAPAPSWFRRGFVGSVVLVIVGLLIYYRIEGVTGDLRPRLVPRFSAKPDQLLPDADDELAGDAKPIELDASAPSYAQFLGPNRNGVLPGPRLARDWSTKPREVWRRPIGAGWGSFSVAGGYAFTQEQRGPEELITCYDLETGELAWSAGEEARFSEKLGGDGPRATPTFDENRIYALGATGIFNCLDATTGKRLWRHNALEDSGAELPIYGIATSPLIVDDLVVISIGGPEGRSVRAFNKQSGELAWSSGNDGVAYASPMLLTLGDTRQIVVVHSAAVAGYDPGTGKQLWRHGWPEADGNPTASQPVLIDEQHLFVSKAYGVGAMLLKISDDGQGAWSTDRVWKKSVMKTKFTTPVLFEGNLYGLDEGYLMCLDPMTGKNLWRRARAQKYGHGQTLLVNDLLLVVCEEPGDIVLVEPTPEEHREVARFPALEGKTWNNPALAGRMLVVRNAEEAACFELPLADDSQPEETASGQRAVSVR